MLDTANNDNLVAKVEDLKVHFNSKRGIVHAVDGVSFEIYKGETLGLVGETGCGKSVTGRSFLQLLPIPPGMLAGGRISFNQKGNCLTCEGVGCDECNSEGLAGVSRQVDLLALSNEEIRKIRGDRIAMIFQDPGKSLNPTLTIGVQLAEVFLQHRTDEILEMAGLGENTPSVIKRFASQNNRSFDGFLTTLSGNRSNKRKLDKAVSNLVAKALADTQVPNPVKLMERYPHELSGGMKQRVMIAQALACNPDILIADEPTTALDVTVEARILDLIQDLQKRRLTSVLYISHDLSLVRRICDRVAVMYAGRIVELGSTGEIFTNPRHPYTRGLMKALPSAEAARGKLLAIPGTVPELINPPNVCRFASRCSYAAEACGLNDPKLENVSGSHAVACFIDNQPMNGERPTYDLEV